MGTKWSFGIGIMTKIDSVNRTTGLTCHVRNKDYSGVRHNRPHETVMIITIIIPLTASFIAVE